MFKLWGSDVKEILEENHTLKNSHLYLQFNVKRLTYFEHKVQSCHNT